MPRSRLIAVAVVAILAVAVGGFVVYDQVLRGDSAAALALPAASAAPGTSAVPAASFDGNVSGTWNVAADSVAGYRVRGKPRSTDDVPGSGQRDVTTLPRV